MMRRDGRKADEARPVTLAPGYLEYAEGSCLATAGNTRVLCAASFETRVPPFLSGSGRGWVTAEYGMLPRSTHQRTARENEWPRGRTQEIKRLIGRALRAVCDLGALGERQIIIDCDVIQADGGTRTLALTGGFVALAAAVQNLIDRGLIARSPIIEHVAATSIGVVDGEVLLDLAYDEDSRADTDMNLVMTESGRVVEVQATAEHMPFTWEQFGRMHAVGATAIERLIRLQHQAIEARGS
jgi:ribonuclease PH